ncbi:hydrolase [Aliidongia dinghuensis]|uniref:Hydrolase n=1 Tax=Aliidongia dinghuensis TaxID=1867774 RepID=A0A8J3E4L0_9PROT|nr:amidohydrolase family protein [Aliidongia dinghuensis]GGF39741.1 hydrolase [Aliidongia dinghuensis]
MTERNERTVLGVRHGAPAFEVPAGATDTHVHVFGPAEHFPFAADRSYTPGAAAVADLERLQALLRLDRVVLVQPSPYGTDNRCLLAALSELGARARAVAVVDPIASDEELQHLRAAGVRGVRLNLESAGQHDPAVALDGVRRLAARIAPLGWHLQTYTTLPVIAALEAELSTLPVPLVIDHFGRATAARGIEQPGFAALLALVGAGRAYVKLSAPCRISAASDYADVADIAQALIRANPDRMLWATDWPHTARRRNPNALLAAIEPFEPEDDGRALNRLNEWTAGDRDLMHRILVRNPARLYGF